MPDDTFENLARADGFLTVCGVDEAGRGPLAGPVFAAAVVLPQGLVIDGLDDSKKLTEKKREALFDEITKVAAAYSVAFATETEIDEMNILQATFTAMKRAVEGLLPGPDLALVDGNQRPPLPIPARTIVKGDARSVSIAAASVLAKVSRDRYMLGLAKTYPQYAFEKHKGYGTKLHYEKIAAHGVSAVHRKTFLKNIDAYA
jgi:ribonuclease HII